MTRRSLVLGSVVLLSVASCSEPTGTEVDVPVALAVLSGNEQTGDPGTELPDPLVVRVENAKGKGVSGQIVNFRVVQGGGTVFAGAAITNKDGIARERWTLGSAGPQRVEARAVDPETGAPLTFAVFTASLTAPTTHALTVTRAGTGSGSVSSAPAGIACGPDCSESFAAGTNVTLTAAPDESSSFTGWSGACSGTGACTVTMDAARSVTATFTLGTFPLAVTRVGSGAGTVTSSPAGISCGLDCAETYDAGTMVTLTAVPATFSTFVGWGGACSGTGACTVTMDAARSVTASFTLDAFTLIVIRSGTGSGTVTSSPAGIACGVDCSESYSAGTMVSLTATPSSGSTFAGWSGACTGTGACVVTMTAAQSVAATFNVDLRTLSVSRSGSGSGTVVSTPAGINCGADCSEAYPAGTVVTLSAAAASGSTFVGWSGGGCSGTAPCTVTLNGATTVTAQFDPTFALHVSKAGSGASLGVVQSAPGGIDCGADCDELYRAGTVVMLTASTPGGIGFASWTGAPGCSTASTCAVTMSGAQNVTATFLAPGAEEPNDTPGTARVLGPLAEGQPITRLGTFHTATDPDWYRFTTVDGEASLCSPFSLDEDFRVQVTIVAPAGSSYRATLRLGGVSVMSTFTQSTFTYDGACGQDDGRDFEVLVEHITGLPTDAPYELRLQFFED